MESDLEPPLPPGWAWASLGELGKTAGGGTPSKSNPGYWTNGRIPWISPKDMKADIVGDVSDKITKVALDNSAAKLIPAGSLLMVTRSGILNHTFPVAISDRPAAVNQDLKTLSTHGGICPWYIKRFLEHKNGEIVHSLVKDGTTVASVDVDGLFALRVPIAPSPEQERITAKIDELFGEIEAGEQELEKAREGLADYRRALLKAAVTGELTREWREANTPIETGSDLLRSILKERKNRVSGRNADPEEADWDDTPDVPRNWAWASLDQLSWNSSYGTSAKCRPDAQGAAVLRIPNIKLGAIEPSDLKFATVELDLSDEDWVRPGDLLVIRTNGSENLIGRGGTVRSQLNGKFYFASYLIRFRLLGDERLWRWISIVWDSPLVRRFVDRNAASTAGQYNISQSKLMKLAIPVPPASEMRVAVDLIEKQFATADEMESSLAQAFPTHELRQSVLAAAFSGRLVPQGSTDEPAAALLERIRTERGKALSGHRKKKAFGLHKPVLRNSETTGVLT